MTGSALSFECKIKSFVTKVDASAITVRWEGGTDITAVSRGELSVTIGIRIRNITRQGIDKGW